MDRRKFQLQRSKNAPVSDAEIISDLRKVAMTTGATKVTQLLYAAHGQYDHSNIGRRFGTWNAALLAAGLEVSNTVGISDEALFENILKLWQHYGRQPRRSELAFPPSTISQSAYRRRFASWVLALKSFVAFADSTEADAPVDSSPSEHPRATGRDPSLRLRFKVLSRDRFTCQACGASPALHPRVELHVDHVVAWSLGGLTVLENLRTLCSRCNLGKSNMPVAG